MKKIMNSSYFQKMLRQSIRCFIAIVFFVGSVFPASWSCAQNTLHLPAPGAMVPLSAAFQPMVIKGIKIDPSNPFQFNFIVDVGDTGLEGADLKKESERLIKYFLASLTIPEEDLWVNLSPYERERIIPKAFGETEMGRDLLAQDYLLKQIVSSLMYPDEEVGEMFWTKIYDKAYHQYGTNNIPVNAFNKVWIVPGKATVYANGNKAFIVDQDLNVMLDQDYLAFAKNDQKETDITRLSASTMREIILPVLSKEINNGQHFSKLRQIYHSMILAAWFKQNLKESVLGKAYMDQRKINGVNLKDKEAKSKIYEQYLQAFKEGVYNYIREEYDPATQNIIPRKYFSGGMVWDIEVDTIDEAMLTEEQIDIFSQSGNFKDLSVVVKTMNGPKENIVVLQKNDIPDALTSPNEDPAMVVQDIQESSNKTSEWDWEHPEKYVDIREAYERSRPQGGGDY